MLKVYGSKMCPDCMTCAMNFDANGIKYEYVDINDSLANLKELLKVRDENLAFTHSKEVGDIGIPALVLEDGSVTLDWEKYMKDQGFDVIQVETMGQACSIDGKGC